MADPLHLDVVVFGGGATGLWLLDALRGAGHRTILLESSDLGGGQTIASQGIIHGGLKYSLRGAMTESAKAIRDMPGRWRRSLAGEERPDLSHTRLRSEFCYLWHTRGMKSRFAMLGALKGLAVTARPLDETERPEVLRQCPGTVARLDEQVIEPSSFIGDLVAQHQGAILAVDVRGGLEIAADPDAAPDAVTGVPPRLVRLLSPADGEPLDLRPRWVILCAGAGNADLRERLGLVTDAPMMQRRPLHMAVVRGDLPRLNGHCVDGLATRLTITSTTDHARRTVWQLGGQVAERGVDMDRETLIAHAAAELAAVVPGLRLAGTDWTTYRVDRAEATTASGQRPGDAALLADPGVLTAWPTKLALVPRLVDQIMDRIGAPAGPESDYRELARWPRPPVAAMPWDEDATWSIDRSAAAALK